MSAIDALPGIAKRHGGRFLVFGSAARGDIHDGDSDLDLIADFPATEQSTAIRKASEACVAARIPHDLLTMDELSKSPVLARFALADAQEVR